MGYDREKFILGCVKLFEFFIFLRNIEFLSLQNTVRVSFLDKRMGYDNR